MDSQFRPTFFHPTGMPDGMDQTSIVQLQQVYMGNEIPFNSGKQKKSQSMNRIAQPLSNQGVAHGYSVDRLGTLNVPIPKGLKPTLNKQLNKKPV